MKTIRKDLCKLNKITKDKAKSLVEYNQESLVGVISKTTTNKYSFILGCIPDTKNVLLIGKLLSVYENGIDDVCVVEIPVLDEVNFGEKNTKIVEIKIDSVYELVPDIFSSITCGVDDIFVDNNDVAYIEGEEYNGVFVLVGKFRRYKGKSYKNEEEVNGVFYTEEDAKRMGESLKDYGRFNDIEYKDYEIHNFLVM